MSGVEASDAELLTAWRGGDKAAGEALFARHFASIARFFRNKVADDIEERSSGPSSAVSKARSASRGS